MMIGFVRPRILLPRTDFAQDELRFILEHELVHYKRKDLYYKGLVLLATAIHWFNPVVYLMARVIGAQCESSCDAQVVGGADADTRQSYSETIIGVVKHQSKLKTALSTNFYGGKMGMKNRIFSIMDTDRKKAGVAVFCAALIFTLGTGALFATNSGAQSAQTPMSYNFLVAWQETGTVPTPEEEAEQLAAIFELYREFGLTFNPASGHLYFNGELVRYFEDLIFLDIERNASAGIIHLSSADGTVDIQAIREFNPDGSVGPDSSLLKLEPFSQAAFDVRDLDALAGQSTLRFYGPPDSGAPMPQAVYTDSNQPAAPGKLMSDTFLEYEEWGIVFDSATINPDGTVSFRTPTNVFYRDQLVRTFADIGNSLWHSSFGNAGDLSIAVIRDDAGNITGIEEMRNGSQPNPVRDRSGNIIGEVEEPVGRSRLFEVLDGVPSQPLNLISAMAGVEEHGITFSSGLANFDPRRDNIYYNGQLVRRLVHQTFFEDGNVIMTSYDQSGRLSVYVLWDEDRNLVGLNVVG